MRMMEGYEHSLVVHDKWIQPAAIVSNWICRRIEKIATSFHSPAGTEPTEAAMILVVGATRARANNLIDTFYSFVDFPKLHRSTGYDVDRVYNNGNEINALVLHNRDRSDLPKIEVHACTPDLAVGYSRGICALFIDGFGEFVQEPGTIDRCVIPLISNYTRDGHAREGVSRALCALIPVYDTKSAELAQELHRNFENFSICAKLAEKATEGEDAAEQSRYACMCLTQQKVDDVLMFYIKREVERVKKLASGSTMRRARSATVTCGLLARVEEEDEQFSSDNDDWNGARREQSGDESSSADNSLVSPRPNRAAPKPTTKEKLRATLKKVERARGVKVRSLRASTTSPPPLPPPPSLIDFSVSSTRLPSLRASLSENAKELFDRCMFDSSSEEDNDLYYGDDDPPPSLSRSGSSSSAPTTDLSRQRIAL